MDGEIPTFRPGEEVDVNLPVAEVLVNETQKAESPAKAVDLPMVSMMNSTDLSVLFRTKLGWDMQALKRQLLRVETEHGVVAKQKDDDAWLQCDEAPWYRLGCVEVTNYDAAYCYLGGS